jgi:hypothetical protein
MFNGIGADKAFENLINFGVLHNLAFLTPLDDVRAHKGKRADGVIAVKASVRQRFKSQRLLLSLSPSA